MTVSYELWYNTTNDSGHGIWTKAQLKTVARRVGLRDVQQSISGTTRGTHRTTPQSIAGI